MRTPDYSRPTVNRPSLDDSAFREGTAWQPYPNREPIIQTNFGRFAHLQYDLHEIGEEIARFVFSPEGESAAFGLTFDQLDQRLENLAQRIPWSDEGTTINPHIMDLK